MTSKKTPVCAHCGGPISLLRKALQAEPADLTINELMEITDLTRDYLKRSLHVLEKNGQVTVTSRNSSTLAYEWVHDPDLWDVPSYADDQFPPFPNEDR